MSLLTIDNIKRKMDLGSDQEYIGSTVFWELSDADMDYDTLMNLLASNSLDARETKDGGLMPHRVTPCSAWKRAIAAFRKSEYVKDNGLVIDSEDIAADTLAKISPKGLLTVHTKSVDGNAGQVGFQQQWALEFDKAAKPDDVPSQVITRKYSIDGTTQDGLYDQVCAEYAKALRQVNLNDVRETIKRVLASAHAFSMRKQGGIYFVSQEFANVVKTLEGIVGCIGDSKLQVLELPKTSSRTVETFKQTLQDSLEAELDTLEKSLTARLDSIKKNKSGEVSNTYNVVIEEMQEFNARADYYSEVLSAKHGELKTRWDALHQTVQTRVASLS
jgi:hypothetical protein